jgi:hypothetical protein
MSNTQMKTSYIERTKITKTSSHSTHTLPVESGITETRSHRERVLAQARICLGRGHFIVPVPSGRKGPMLKNWPSLRIKEEKLEELFGKTTISAVY